MKMSLIKANAVVTVEDLSSTRYKVVLKDYSNLNSIVGFIGTPAQCAEFITRKTGELVILA